VLASSLAALPTPGVLAAASVAALYAGRVLVMRLMSKDASSPAPSIVKVVE
jgi:hypothetical protein